MSDQEKKIRHQAVIKDPPVYIEKRVHEGSEQVGAYENELIQIYNNDDTKMASPLKTHLSVRHQVQNGPSFAAETKLVSIRNGGVDI